MTLWNQCVEARARQEWRVREDRLLAAQLAYVREKSAFYQRKLRAVGSGIIDRQALAALPFTEKDELREDQEEFPPFGSYLAASPSAIVRVHKTSGTTGRALYIALTRRDVEITQECGARAFFASGLRPGDRVVHCLNYQLWAGGLTDHLSLERVGATVVPFGVGNTRGLLRTIRDLRIDAISSTPSYLVHLADIVRKELNVEPYELGLRKGFFGGEPGLQNPRVREQIEQTWGLRAMDANYGMADVLSIFGSECERREGLHFHGQEVLLVELIDPTTHGRIEIETGATGELVYTNLTREAQPLVRYRSHDVAQIVASDICDCGRTSFRFRILGRSDEMVHVRGVNVFPSAIAEVLAGFSTDLTGEFQIVLDAPPPYDLLKIRAETSESRSTQAPAVDLGDRVAAALHEQLNFRADIELVPCGALPRTEGKAIRVVKSYT